MPITGASAPKADLCGQSGSSTTRREGSEVGRKQRHEAVGEVRGRVPQVGIEGAGSAHRAHDHMRPSPEGPRLLGLGSHR